VTIDDEYGYSILHPGEKGDAVAKLTRSLADLKYYSGSISVNYDNKDRDNIMAFQKDHDLANDGVAGTATLALLDKVYEGHTLKKAIEQYTDAQGMLSLRLFYQFVPYDGGIQKPSEGMQLSKSKYAEQAKKMARHQMTGHFCQRGLLVLHIFDKCAKMFEGFKLNTALLDSLLYNGGQL
jgi:hypothetical protein